MKSLHGVVYAETEGKCVIINTMGAENWGLQVGMVYAWDQVTVSVQDLDE